MDGLDESQLTISFCAQQTTAGAYYSYQLYAVAAEGDQDPISLSSGRKSVGEEIVQTVNLRNLSSGTYSLVLEVTIDDGGIELFDTQTLNGFRYQNPYEPSAIENFDVDVDVDSHRVTVSWGDWSNWNHDGYYVTVTNDDTKEIIYENQVESDGVEISTLYPVDANGITVSLQYLDGSVWSTPLTKTIPLLNGEYLKTDGVEVTGSGQAKLYYKAAQRKSVYVEVNGENGAEFFVEGEGYLSIPLNPGANTLYALMAAEDGTSRMVEAEIYYDAYPPEILIYDALDGKTIQGENVHILGATEGGSQLTINEVAVPMEADGTFDYLYPLVEGENVVTIRAVDTNGNGAIRSLTIYRPDASQQVAEQVMSYLPLMVAGGISLVLILAALVLLKPQRPDQKRGGGKLALVLLAVILVAGEIALCLRLYQLHQRVNSMEFLEIAEQSLTQAAQLVAERDEMMKLTTAGAGVVAGYLLIWLVVAKIRRVLANRQERKAKQASTPIRRFCANCGQEIVGETTQFCINCGTPVEPQEEQKEGQDEPEN